MHTLVLQLAVQVLGGDEFVIAAQRIPDRILLTGLTYDVFTHWFEFQAFFKSFQQPVDSRSATVSAVSSVSTVMCPILRSWRTSALQ